MAAKAVEKLVRELVCAVCMNTLKNPKSLSCRHTFCEECLKQCDEASQGRSGGIRCPMCREVTTLPRVGVAGLKSNPLIYRVLEVLEAKKNSTQIICDACGDSESPLTTYCRDCLHFICDSCASSHSKMKLLMKDHRTVPLDKIENGTIKIKWMEEGLWRKAHECEEHGGELRRFYCRTCKKRICRDCIVLDHTKPDHDCTTVQKMFQETKEKLQDRLKTCEEKEEHVSTMLNDVDARETGANQKFHKMKKSIRDQKSKAVDNLDKAEEELLQKVDVLEEKLNVKLQAFRDNMNTTKENLTRAQSKAKEVVSAKEVTDISRGPFLPEDVLKELEELIASDVTMTISVDLVALKSTMIEGSKMPEQMARFAKLSLSRVWRETLMFPIPDDKDIVNIFSDGKAMYVACKKVIYKKLLSSEAKPSIWLNLQLNASIKQVVDVAISMKDQTFSFIADTDAACTQLYRLKLEDFPKSDEHTTVPPCPLNPSARLTVDSQSLIVVADNKPAISSSSQTTSSESEPVSETKPTKTTSSPVVEGSQTVSAIGSAKSLSKAEGTLSPSDSKGKETRPDIPKAGSDIFTISTKIYREKTEKSSSQLSSDNFEVPLDRVRSLAAAKTGQLVFLRGDKKAVIITDKDGGVQLEIKEPGRMYLSISCTESDALYVLSAFWGSHIVTLAKHSLEDGGPLEYIIDELDVSADFQSDEWPVIGNYGNDLVIMHTGDGIRVFSAEDWDILDDKDANGQDQDDDKEEDV
eukprot:XP_003723615.1 PREDICTED: uncharacterized protein LOC100891477 [Strongylocentrotus purpuratus]